MAFPKEKISAALKTLNGTQDSIKGLVPSSNFF